MQETGIQSRIVTSGVEMQEEIIEVTIQKLVGLSPNGAAVFLQCPEKTFVIFIGSTEGEALIRALHSEETPRPLTHDLIRSLLIGFEIRIRQLVISQIIDGAFCATLILEQGDPGNGDLKSEVRIDTRPSDAFVLAARLDFPIHVTRSVLDQVEDLTNMTDAQIPLPDPPDFPGIESENPDDERGQ